VSEKKNDWDSPLSLPRPVHSLIELFSSANDAGGSGIGGKERRKKKEAGRRRHS